MNCSLEAMSQSNLKYCLASIFTIPLLPLLYIQGKRVRSSVPSLPEANNPSGTLNIGSNQTLRLLTIGESTIAGVGVSTHEEGFSGTLALSLAESMNANIEWRVYARSGYTINQLTHKIIPKIEEKSVDIIVIGMGGNDAFELNSPKRWRKGVIKLISTLQSKFVKTPIIFTNMPPIKDFPAFTPLIKLVMGNLVLLYRHELISICKNFPNVYFSDEVITLSDWIKRLDSQYQPHDFFSDGVHPSKLTYQTWAKEISKFAVQNIELKI